MMIAALLLAAAPAPMTAVDAERAFAADAEALGQWTAFRKWATADAVMFVPQRIKAQEFLQPLKDPPKSVDWWPTASFVSCDGKVAANTGGALWPDGRHGYFSTVWARQGNRAWRWTLDHGDDLATARVRPTELAVRRASCRGKPPKVVTVAPAYARFGGGQSPDRTLNWNYVVYPNGARSFDVSLWTGAKYETVVSDRVGTFTMPDLIKPK